MILTEEEASTKRCQEGYAASPGAAREPVTEYGTVTQAVPVMSSVGSMGGFGATMATTAEPKTAPIFCLGSQCMAWRWWNGIGRKGTGYCGKAGNP